MISLYHYFRSSASFRVRIALNYKGLPYQSMPVHLLRDGGEQHGVDFRRRNPAQLVPVLEHAGQTITQSMAIIEYLDDIQREPPLLPPEPVARAHVRSLALAIACDIHPLNNLRVLRYLKDPFAIDDAGRDQWARHWIALGFAALEDTLSSAGRGGRCCYGDTPTLADCYLIPQVFNAKRVNCPLEPYPRIVRVFDYCMQLDAFSRAAPSAQPDAE
ncbi:MAG TPA: maleylacetoacetate isomerase [Steroidobacteraceae bacterium]|jgi:maleylacetoacetate isomerase